MRWRQRTIDPGQWAPRQGRTRVLVEDPDGAVRWACERFLREEGYDVAVCGGPESTGRRCLAVAEGDCPLAAGADVIYTSLRWQDPDSREVLTVQQQLYPTTPIVIEVTQPVQKTFGRTESNCQMVPVPATRADMLRAVRRALASPPAGDLQD